MPVLPNPRHERFAQELAKGKSASEAYANAGYKANDGNAATLKGNQRVEQRIAELLNKAASKTEVTIETLAAQLDEDRALAHKIEQPGAAVSASTAKAKLFGYMKEKHEVTGANGGPVQTEDVSVLTAEERAVRIANILAQAKKRAEGTA